MKETILMSADRGTDMMPQGIQGLRSNYHFQRQQAELLIEAGAERCRAMFTQGAITDVVTLCNVAAAAKQFAPEGAGHYDRLIAEHVEATLQQIRRMGE